MTRRGTLVFGVSAAFLLSGVMGALLFVSAARARDVQLATPVDIKAVAVRQPIRPPLVMFRTLAPREAHGRIAMVAAGDSGSIRHVAPLSCARVSYAAGVGLCLIEEADQTRVRHRVVLFDRDFARGTVLDLTGVPTRARVSRDGRLAAVTEYAEEESPAGERLAIETILIDVVAGRVLADLREFAVVNPKNLALPTPIDFSGVAFTADSDRFFATLSTPAERYLVEGSVRERRLTIVATGVAGEAVSPDGTRLVVKKRVGDRGFWQLAVLDLATMIERPLNHGERSVDDQVEWLDDEHVVYHDVAGESTGIWSLAVDGITGPRLLVPDAFSPSIER